MNNYEILGIDYNADQRVIKRAYATLIKQYRPDSHPVEFARIRLAYETALEYARYRELDDEAEYGEDCVTTSSEPEPPIILQQPDHDDSVVIDKIIFDKPVIQLAETQQAEPATDSEERWQPPTIDVAALIIELNAYKQPAQELATLVCFNMQLATVKEMTLDQRMDYEERLYNSLIYSDRPALLLFAWANHYFDWKNTVMWIKAGGNQWNQRRFEALFELSEIYRRICHRYNPYFQAQHDAQVKPQRFTTHYHHEQKTQQRDAWRQICKNTGLEEVADYMADKPTPYPVYWVDVFLGAGIGSMIWIVFNFHTLSAITTGNSMWSLALLLLPVIAIVGSLLWVLLWHVWLHIWQASIIFRRGVIGMVICMAVIAYLDNKMGYNIAEITYKYEQLNYLFIVIIASTCIAGLHLGSVKLETIVAKVFDKIRFSLRK